MMFPFLKTAISNIFTKPNTEAFPNPAAEGLGNYRGRIVFHPESCVDCGNCIRVCSPIAITKDEEKVEGGKNVTRHFDLTSCTFCATCVDFCDEGSIEMSKDYHMVAEDTNDLIVSGTSFIKDIEGVITCNVKDCIYCGLCMKNCPQSVITVDRPTKNWDIDLSGCVKCGICIGKCPKKVLAFEEEGKQAEYRKLAAEAAAAEPAKPAAPAAPAGGAAPAAGAAAPAAGAAAPAAAPKPAPKPANPEEWTDGESGDLICDKGNCVYCGLCAKNCPVEAITVNRDNKEWSVDHDTCIKCGLCTEKCPKKVLKFKE